jgi:hypothetical protein
MTKTISGVQITATPNHKNKTFTLRKDGNKYRTGKMNNQDFTAALDRTANDWQSYLRNSGDYYLVK